MQTEDCKAIFDDCDNNKHYTITDILSSQIGVSLYSVHTHGYSLFSAFHKVYLFYFKINSPSFLENFIPKPFLLCSNLNYKSGIEAPTFTITSSPDPALGILCCLDLMFSFFLGCHLYQQVTSLRNGKNFLCPFKADDLFLNYLDNSCLFQLDINSI